MGKSRFAGKTTGTADKQQVTTVSAEEFIRRSCYTLCRPASLASAITV
jgi:hypothetical protein